MKAKSIFRSVLCMMLLATTMVGFSSCDKDDDDDDNALIGSWELVEKRYTNSYNNREPETGSYYYDQRLTFKSDETLVIQEDGEVEHAKWKHNGTQLQLIFEGEDGVDIETFEVNTLNNETLILTITDYDEEGTYVTVTTYKKL